jgi:hypothetical protein
MRSMFILAAAVALSTAAVAQPDKDHASHHPAGAPAPEAPARAVKATPKPTAKGGAPSSAQMDAMMKSMQEMHAKMMVARTPEERQVLMADHMKTMQDGMAMMNQMREGMGAMGSGGGTAASPEIMGKRMDMMEMMMQMMMDREAAGSVPAK